MRARITTRLSLALLFAGAMGVSAGAAAAQSNPQGTKPAVKPGAKTTHHARSTRKSSRRVKGQKTPEAQRISEIQTALAKDGSFTGTPSGQWDDATVAAMKKYQEAHGLNPSGKLDAKTLQSLGLGSQTAGLAPPAPPVSSTSLT